MLSALCLSSEGFFISLLYVGLAGFYRKGELVGRTERIVEWTVIRFFFAVCVREWKFSIGNRVYGLSDFIFLYIMIRI